MACNTYTNIKSDSQKSTKNFLVAKTIIDKFNKILDFTKWSNEAGRLNKIAKDTYNLPENILSSEQQGKVASFNKPMFDEIDRQKSNSTKYQLNNDSGLIASEKTIRDLTARMSDRIGIPVKFESDRSLKYKGKIENNVAYVNLAYATLDTIFHEVAAHPIIRTLKMKSKNSINSEIEKMIEIGIIKKEC